MFVANKQLESQLSIISWLYFQSYTDCGATFFGRKMSNKTNKLNAWRDACNDKVIYFTSSLYLQVILMKGRELSRIRKDGYSFHLKVQGRARTQSPTNINYAPESPTFGVIARVSQTVVQWKGLALKEPPSWSWLPLCQVSMSCCDRLSAQSSSPLSTQWCSRWYTEIVFMKKNKYLSTVNMLFWKKITFVIIKYTF